MAHKVPAKTKTPSLETTALILAETWLWQQCQEKVGPKARLHRLRMWAIFMLLRYAGLRVVDILKLRHQDLDCQKALLCLEQRLIPIPNDIARRLKPIWQETFAFLEKPLACDPSLIRKTFQHCSEACGLPKGVLTARSLRKNRAQELCKQGLTLPVVNLFLGRKNSQADSLESVDPKTAQKILCEHIHAGQIMKTSARNVFQGRVESLKKQGILVQVVLQTAGGLHISAVITDTSCKRLALAKGVLLNASIKAPWVFVFANLPSPLPENCYTGTVESVRSDPWVTEVVVTLPEGSQVTSLQSHGPEGLSLAKGDPVTVHFKAFSVILHLA
ncbi:MAG: TOBE domain-containing protein [Desulfovibrio sp.]|nr:TOBE domain-containing protein [Desulfovibrio sp.]